ncbi:unnamed protein product [Owenia fusiformis]|uniref:Uncharacterized protein n=1 Tax=Owenia fusiformis TaxID=6347 RepID=A0A8J1XJN0_OWEFU|nr:unnamed protein product [Owenia fusiformis]
MDYYNPLAMAISNTNGSLLNESVSNYSSLDFSQSNLSLFEDVYGNLTFHSRMAEEKGLLRLLISAAVLCVIAVFFNVFSIVAIYCIPSGQNMHTTLFMNLSIADTLGAIACFLEMFAKVYFQWNKTKSNIIAVTFHVTVIGYMFFFVMFYIVSALTLLLFAVARYIAIFRPLSFNKIGNRQKTICLVLAIWVLSALMSSPAFCVVVEVHYSIALPSCDYWNYIWPSIVFVVFLIITCLYIKVTHDLHVRCIRMRAESSTKDNFRALITTIILISMLILSLLPYLIFKLFRYHFSVDLREVYYNFIYFLPFTHYILDPIIYGWRTKTVQAGYKAILIKLKIIQNQIEPNGNSSFRRTSFFGRRFSSFYTYTETKV